MDSSKLRKRTPKWPDAGNAATKENLPIDAGPPDEQTPHIEAQVPESIAYKSSVLPSHTLRRRSFDSLPSSPTAHTSGFRISDSQDTPSGFPVIETLHPPISTEDSTKTLSGCAGSEESSDSGSSWVTAEEPRDSAQIEGRLEKDNVTRPWVPDDQFCQSCQSARGSAVYDAQIASLFKRLYCSGCHLEHPTLFFSPSQRAANDRTRICVGRQGQRTLCPHWKISFDDLFQSKSGLQRTFTAFQTLHCDDTGHRNCPFCDLYVEVWNGPSCFEVELSWSAHPPESAQTSDREPGSSINRRKSSIYHEIRRLYNACPRAFGPHWADNPEALFNLDFSARYAWESSSDLFRVFATLDSSMFSCCLGDAPFAPIGAPITFRGQFLVADPRNACDRMWIKELDLDSYDHFSDDATKHITWCGTHGCATMKGMVRCTVLRQMAFDSVNPALETYFNREPDMVRDKLEHLSCSMMNL